MLNLGSYQDFVLSVTSDESRYHWDFVKRIESLRSLHTSLLITAALGISSEAGEFQEIVKKIIFQGKPYDDETREHMIKELGDVMWYIANAANALDVDLEEIIQKNIEKLEARYPHGFDAFRSENKNETDI